MSIEVYTDGSATTADKPGGWAYVIVSDGVKKAECSGHVTGATNNDMELEGAIQGLSALIGILMSDRTILPNDITLCSDSKLVLGWANGTYRFKQENKMHKYREFCSLIDRLKVKTKWIKGHSGNEYNERCDELANEARLGVSRAKDREEARAAGKTLIGIKKSGIVCLWYKDKLKIVDLETNVIEDYDREVHGHRGSKLQILEERFK